MYSVIRALVCAIIVGSITNESFMLLRSKSRKCKVSESWTKIVSDTGITNIGRHSLTQIISSASKFDDYSSAIAANYDTGWLTTLRSLVDRELAKHSDHPSKNVEMFGDDMHDIEIRSNFDSNSSFSGNVNTKTDHGGTYMEKKVKGTIRRDVKNILREIKEHIKNGRKSNALEIFKSKTIQLELNFLEVNFLATKMMGEFSYFGDWSVCEEILELLKILEFGPDSFSVSAAMSVYIK